MNFVYYNANILPSAGRNSDLIFIKLGENIQWPPRHRMYTFQFRRSKVKVVQNVKNTFCPLSPALRGVTCYNDQVFTYLV